MKSYILVLLLSLLQTTEAPIGIWEYKQDKSRLEIQSGKGKIQGTLISSMNPQRTAGKEILKNLEFRGGKWKGEFLRYPTDQWVEVTLEVRGHLLFMEYTYGIQTTRLHFYRVNKGHVPH